MDPKKFYSQKIKIGGTAKVEPVITPYLAPQYALKLNSDAKGSRSGHVKVAELIGKNSNYPSFIFRWDLGAGALDIDIFIAGNYQNDLWRQPGYQGHWTQVHNKLKGEYKVKVEIPGRKIFEGII